jgi:hypothetical protein
MGPRIKVSAGTVYCKMDASVKADVKYDVQNITSCKIPAVQNITFYKIPAVQNITSYKTPAVQNIMSYKITAVQNVL